MKNNWNELKDIKAPQELKERTLAAAREARKLTNEPLHAVPRHPWGMAKRLLAAACAFGIVLGGTAVYRTHNGTAQTGSAAVADAISHTFGFAAYAADTGELRQPKDSKIVFDTGSGADDPEKGFYSGCLFKVTGENIKTISATIDKGAVYRTKTVKDTSADRDEWVRSMHQGTNPELDGADRIMVWGSDEMHMYADLCWKLDNGIPVNNDAAMLKRYGAPGLTDCCSRALQLMGGLGFTDETRVSRLMLDCRGFQIGGGTVEIMVHISGRGILKEYAKGVEDPDHLWTL